MKNFRKKKEDILFERLTEEWMLYKKHEIKESTYLNYRYKIDQYLETFFRGKDIAFFVDYDFNLYKEYLINEKGLSSKTIKDILLVLKSILKLAERKYDVQFKLDLLSMPKSRKKEMKVLNSVESKKLKNHCLESEDLREVGILICIYTGLRVGEICGLRWSDIDFVKKTISVRRTLQRVYLGKNETKIVIDMPKTENSIRVIPLCSVLYEKLKDMRPSFSKDSYILTGRTDKYIEPRSYQYTFGSCLRKCKITPYNFHALRHTFATDCIAVGMDVKSLSEILGHSDVSVTLNRYVHSSYKMKKKYIEKL